MKKIFLVLSLLFIVRVASAQKDLLSFSEQNKYIYYQVVEEPGLTADTMHTRALYFLKTEYPLNKIKEGAASGDFTGTGKILITSSLSVVKHVYGEISYTYFIECKAGKYRYWLTDYVYTPHKTDRYGNSVPEPGLDIPLEDGASKVDKREFGLCLDAVGAYSKQFGDKLKESMVRISNLSPKETKKTVVTTKDW
jgi:hypothetical protein